ncbi:MAG: hypothetical protein RJA34_2809 [Pseudomonadota bacterium]
MKDWLSPSRCDVIELIIAKFAIVGCHRSLHQGVNVAFSKYEATLSGQLLQLTHKHRWPSSAICPALQVGSGRQQRNKFPQVWRQYALTGLSQGLHLNHDLVGQSFSRLGAIEVPGIRSQCRIEQRVVPC